MNCKRILSILLFLNFTLHAQYPDKEYIEKITGSDQEIPMVLIPAGEYTMGSRPEEKDRKKDEGPAHTVKISSFWMGKYEIPWDVYQLFIERQIDDVDAEQKGTEVD